MLQHLLRNPQSTSTLFFASSIQCTLPLFCATCSHCTVLLTVLFLVILIKHLFFTSHLIYIFYLVCNLCHWLPTLYGIIFLHCTLSIYCPLHIQCNKTFPVTSHLVNINHTLYIHYILCITLLHIVTPHVLEFYTLFYNICIYTAQLYTWCCTL